MCTVTIIPLRDVNGSSPAGYRLATNRDESLDRAPASEPAHRNAQGVLAVWPLDTQAGGTWLAVNERGLALTLLNGNPDPPPRLTPMDRRPSRGSIIPALASCATAEESMDALASLALGDMAPFRLIAADLRVITDARWDCQRLSVERRPLAPMCAVSSGLGDWRVEPRLGLFDSWFQSDRPSPDEQDAFHRHAWPDKPEISVMMRRADARTVSTTIIEVRTGDQLQISMSMCDDAGEHRCSIEPDAVGAATQSFNVERH